MEMELVIMIEKKNRLRIGLAIAVDHYQSLVNLLKISDHQK